MSKLILVTGGAGFIGSHLCERLVLEGHRVISLDNYFTGTRENHVEGVEYREGHTKDIEDLVSETPEIIYHLGEYSRVEKSFEDVEVVWDLNKAGTFAVLEFVRQRGSKIVYAGSSTKFSDGGLGRDQSPYAWSKATNTELVRNYASWFSVPYAITYFYNVYGPRERAGAFGTVIEIFRQCRLSGSPLGVTLPGTQRRNFTHVADIVDGLVLVGEKGEGDDFGLGDERSYSISEVAELFEGDVMFLPERQGNRMGSEVDTQKSRALGWQCSRSLQTYIAKIISTEERLPSQQERRVLVFTTTFYPTMGPAERALCTLMQSMPDIHFDIVTAAHTKEAGIACPVVNATVYRVGWGTVLDKFFLPILGGSKGRELDHNHQYLFSWSLMASYGTLAAMSVRRKRNLPLLVTLADQNLSWYELIFLRLITGRTDQVYASSKWQGKKLASLETRMRARKSLGRGDAFANQLRFAYSAILAKGEHR